MSRAAALSLSLAWLAAECPAQCPPVTTTVGFNQQRYGRSLSADGGYAIVGQTRGFRADIVEILGDGTPRLATRLGTSSKPGSMGFATAMKGKTVVAGDPGDSTRPARGAIAIGELSGSTWITAAMFYPPTSGGGNQLGLAVAISDDEQWIAAGAPLENGGGAVYLYRRINQSWALDSSIRATNSTPVNFGSSLAMAGGRLLVGATREAQARGAVYAFERRGNAWTQTAKLTAPNNAPNENFGFAIAATANRILISAPYRGVGSAPSAGEVFEYQPIGSGWVLANRLRSSPPTPQQSFGASIDILGNQIAIGGNGHAEILAASPSGWRRFARYARPNPTDSSVRFGNAIALFDGGVLIGDFSYDINGTGYPHSSGALHTYDLDGFSEPFDACQKALGGRRRDRVTLRLNAPRQANRTYWILGSLSGIGPITVQGVRIPLTWDAYMQLTVTHPNRALLVNSIGQLDANGSATAEFAVPRAIQPLLLGAEFRHAFITFQPNGSVATASNPVTTAILR